nr:MAG TPA: hypothetical protein [Caudoviricetes sp.]
MPAAPTIPAPSAKPAAPAAGFCFARSDRASVGACPSRLRTRAPHRPVGTIGSGAHCAAVSGFAALRMRRAPCG